MKEKIHPKFGEITVECDCGNTFKVGSTKDEKINVEVCAACHPLYTGKQKLIDTTGRVKRFKQMMEKSKELKSDKGDKKKPTGKKKTDKKDKKEK